MEPRTSLTSRIRRTVVFALGALVAALLVYFALGGSISWWNPFSGN